MRIAVVLACGALAACSSGAVTVPSESVLYEVPYGGTTSTAGGAGSFTSTIGAAIDDGGATTVAAAPSPDGTGPALDQDRINLMQWTLEQQKIDAAKAERDLAQARSQLVIVQPTGSVPGDDGVNVALYAKQSRNAVGQPVYSRSVGARVAGMGACGRYRDPDAAQRAFLAAGGPQSDRLGLDPDGDGFACTFDPSIYRALN